MKKLSELIGFEFAEGVKGIGQSGISFDEQGNFNGYLYASQGYGNMETYWEIESLIEEYPELSEVLVSIELTENKISYLHS